MSWDFRRKETKSRTVVDLSCFCSKIQWNVGLKWKNKQKQCIQSIDLTFHVSRRKYTKQFMEKTGKLLSKLQVRKSDYTLSSLAWEDNTLYIAFMFSADSFSTKSCKTQCSDIAIIKSTKHFYGNSNTTVERCPQKKPF